MGKTINIRPTTSVYATYKNFNYQIWTAIAEFVDNSTQSYYSNQQKLEETKYWKGLKIEINYYPDENNEYYLEIKDNAYGMDFNDFKRAVILDSKPMIANRSEFGMGLKTAACWFGLKWSVETTELGSPISYKAEVDVEQLSKYKNEEIEVEETPATLQKHGTIIRISELNRNIVGRSVGKMKAMLASMYRVDLRTGQIKIFYNDEELSYTEPEIYTEDLDDGVKRVWKKDIFFVLEHNNKSYPVKGFVGIRDVANTKEAGFTLLRRGRAIIGGYENNYRPSEIFGSSNSYEYQRLFGELHMDQWPVVQTKDNFDWHNGLEDKFIEKLKENCEEYIKKAKVIRKRKTAKVSDVIQKTVESFERQGIISESIIKDYTNPEDTLKDGETQLDNLLVEENYVVDENEHVNVKTDNIILEDNVPKTINFKLGSEEYIFNLIIEQDDPDAQWLKITHKDNEYNIIWNIKHIFFKDYMKDPEFILTMQKFIFAFAIAEVKQTSYSAEGLIHPYEIRNEMNNVLKVIGEYKDE